MSGFDARLLVWVKPRKIQHEQIFSAVPPIADILGGLPFGLQQARLLFHNHSLHETSSRAFFAARFGGRKLLRD